MPCAGRARSFVTATQHPHPTPSDPNALDTDKEGALEHVGVSKEKPEGAPHMPVKPSDPAKLSGSR